MFYKHLIPALAREAGADEVILYAEQDFEAEVMRLTGGKGVNVVYDSVAKTTFEKSLNCVGPRGVLALFGQSSGPVPAFDPARLAKNAIFLTRPGLGQYTATREELAQRAGDVFEWVRSGRLHVRGLANAAAPGCGRGPPTAGGAEDDGKGVAGSVAQTRICQTLTMQGVR